MGCLTKLLLAVKRIEGVEHVRVRRPLIELALQVRMLCYAAPTAADAAIMLVIYCATNNGEGPRGYFRWAVLPPCRPLTQSRNVISAARAQILWMGVAARRQQAVGCWWPQMTQTQKYTVESNTVRGAKK